MKSFTLLLAFLSLSFLTSCDNDDDTINPVDFPVEGKFYRLTSLTLTEAVDANNDGIYSFNLMDEIGCGYSLYFENDTSNNPAATGIGINVTDDGNSNMEQEYSCTGVSAAFPLWLKRDNIIYFYFQGETWESATYMAELSSDNRSLSFEMSMDFSPIFGKEILREDGTLIQYQDTAQLIYTLEE